MRISHRHRFVFFAFPKTGSESVRKALGPISDIVGVSKPTPDFPYPNHIRPGELRPIFDANGWPFEDYYRFVFVRNPWARMASLYRMIRNIDGGYKASFAEWLVNARPHGVGGGNDPVEWRYRRFGAYTLDNFVADETGKRLVSEVFRLEDMPTVPRRLRERGIPFPDDAMPWVNRSPPTDLDRFYTPALRAVVAMRYAKDIEEFGYRYPG
jgi:hypothetical protein